MQRRNLGFVWVLVIILIVLCLIAETGNESTTSPSTNLQNTNQGILPDQTVATNTPQELWRLETFQEKEETGLPYDQGLFVNDATGERTWAQCLDPLASDPTEGDYFTRSGDFLSPVSGVGQNFQSFQVISITPTFQTTPTFLPGTVQTPQEFLPEGQKKPLTVGEILFSVAALALLAVLLMAIGRYLHRNR